MTFLIYDPLGITLRKKCPNTEFFLVRIFLYSDQKKLRIWIIFTECIPDNIFHMECIWFTYAQFIQTQ